jgi:hypothetical protein
MVGGHRSIAPPLDAERIIVAQLADHAARLDGTAKAPGLPRVRPAARGPGPGDPPGSQVIRNRVVQAGLMDHGEPKG